MYLLTVLVISSDFLETTRINILTDLTGNTLDLGKIKVKKLPDPPYTSCPGDTDNYL